MGKKRSVVKLELVGQVNLVEFSGRTRVKTQRLSSRRVLALLKEALNVKPPRQKAGKKHTKPRAHDRSILDIARNSSENPES